MISKDGNKYIGAWRDDVQHGVGIVVDAKDGSKRQGEWQNGKRLKWLT